MFSGFRHKFRESLQSVLPVSAIVLVLSVTITPLPLDKLVMFLAGAVLLIVGMSLFNAGVDMSMRPLGEAMGAEMTRRRRIGLILATSFFIGFIIEIPLAFIPFTTFNSPS